MKSPENDRRSVVFFVVTTSVPSLTSVILIINEFCLLSVPITGVPLPLLCNIELITLMPVEDTSRYTIKSESFEANRKIYLQTLALGQYLTNVSLAESQDLNQLVVVNRN